MQKRLLAASLLAGLGLGLGLGVAPPASAQSITGGLYGRVPAGKQLTVRIAGEESGMTRDLTPNASGRYRATGLNPGRYKVTVLDDGRTIATRTVVVKAGSKAAVMPVLSTSATAQAQANAQHLKGVSVTANSMYTVVNPIDVSTPELATTYSMKLVNQLPTGRSMESIALLKSNVRYDNQTTGLVQFGGASPAENRYYYNGFDTTNDRTSLGAQRLPAEAIASTQVLTGGYGASWTNATGGVMAATVRQGTNNFKAGYSLYFTPPTSRLLEPRGHNVVDPNGNYYHFVSANHHSSRITQYLWASGALVKNKLFYFVLLGNKPPSKSEGTGLQTQSVTSSRDKKALINVTWNITDSQSLNVVGFKDTRSSFTNSYWLKEHYNPNSRGEFRTWSYSPVKTRFLIGNYHLHVTDDLSFVLMAGFLGEDDYHYTPASQYGDLPYVTRVDPVTQQSFNIGLNPLSSTRDPDRYWKRGFKAEMHWQLGDHRIVLGGEYYKHFLYEHWITSPGGNWTYYTHPNELLPNGEHAPADGKYVTQYYDSELGQFYTVNKASFIEDYWQVSDKVLLYAGLRYDIYNNKDRTHRNFLHLPMLSPRLGISWDVFGDSTLKVGATVGRYSLSMPSNFSFGVAETKTQWQKYYTYTGMDPKTKKPTGLNQIGSIHQTRFGKAPPAYAISTTNIQAPMQDEAQIYAQWQINPVWAAQVDLSYANLKRVIDDTCDGFKIDAYVRSHGYPNYDANGEEALTCVEFNPGERLDLRRDFAGNGETQFISIPNSYYGMPDAKHKYYSMTLQLTHRRSDAQPYYLNVSYTWKHMWGNTGGYLDLARRDAGYIGQTPQFDFPGIMRGATGNLAGDTRNNLTASGLYYFDNGLYVGALLNMHTGSPLSCFGTYPDRNSYLTNYHSSTHFCDGEVSPLGSAGRLPFFWSLNLSVGYNWIINQRNKLSLTLQIHNVTNRKGVIDRNQTYDLGYYPANGMPPRNIDYGLPDWQAPRTTSLALRYTFD